MNIKKSSCMSNGAPARRKSPKQARGMGEKKAFPGGRKGFLADRGIGDGNLRTRSAEGDQGGPF